MANSRALAIQQEHIRHDLDHLLGEIAAVHDAQDLGDEPAHALHSFPPPPAQSRLARLTARLKRQTSLKRKGGQYAALDERHLLRRASDESGAEDPLDRLLAQLAPLILTLQQLTPRIVALGAAGRADCSLDRRHGDAGARLARLIDGLRREQGGEEYALEMRALMLAALAKKVEAERAALAAGRLAPKLAVADSDAPSGLRPAGSPRSTQPSQHSSPWASPLCVRAPDNPFVVHSTSLLQSGRRASHARAIPTLACARNPGDDADEILVAPPSYHSFMGTSQLTARALSMNVIRLGSFQASALFSPSPVAIRRMPGAAVKA